MIYNCIIIIIISSTISIAWVAKLPRPERAPPPPSGRDNRDAEAARSPPAPYRFSSGSLAPDGAVASRV